ncbi:ethanolamine ammonia lyase large subunit [Salmonella enterica subsp. enterica]|nr:ethanolamine ammonia lyase large subunit [Salmonella enterica subsp. enterica]
MEARNYGLARHYDPFLVNTVVGFIGPEYLYNDRQIIRAGLEDHFMGQAERHLDGLRLLLYQPCRRRPEP